MKIIASFFFLLLFSVNTNIEEIRKLYVKAYDSEVNSKEFAKKLESISSDNDVVLVAYKGASMAMVSKYEKKAGQKIKAFKEGAKLIESSIASQPENIELRMIRLSVQESVPKIVKYHKNITEDKSFVLENYTTQSATLREYLKNFILQSKSFSKEEKKSVN